MLDQVVIVAEWWATHPGATGTTATATTLMIEMWWMVVRQGGSYVEWQWLWLLCRSWAVGARVGHGAGGGAAITGAVAQKVQAVVSVVHPESCVMVQCSSACAAVSVIIWKRNAQFQLAKMCLCHVSRLSKFKPRYLISSAWGSCSLYMWTGGHVALQVVKVTWVDLEPFAFSRHLVSQFWIARRLVCSLWEATIKYFVLYLSKQATWRPQRQHNYSNKRTTDNKHNVRRSTCLAHGRQHHIDENWHKRATTSGGEYFITTEDGRVRPKHVLREFKKWMCYIDGQKNKYSVLWEGMVGSGSVARTTVSSAKVAVVVFGEVGRSEV
jgi:hypothetical protein